MSIPSRLLVVVGARPNIPKLAPLVRAARAHDSLQLEVVHTGQHYDAALNADMFAELGLPAPTRNFEVGSGTHAMQTAAVMVATERACAELDPRAVVVIGDVNSTLGAALGAAKLGVPVAHVEAGLRSYDRRHAEELNRVLIDHASTWLFAPTEGAADNLRAEGIPRDRIHTSGNVAIDSLLRVEADARALGAHARHGVDRHGYALVTVHRAENVDTPPVLARIVDGLAGLAEALPLVFAAHPRTRAQLREAGLEERLAAAPNVRFVGALGYVETVSLLADAALVVTDSGGLQDESTALGVPCLTLRETTERPITVAEGTNTVVGSDPMVLVREARRILDGGAKPGRRPLLWDGHAAERVLATLAAALR